MSGGPSKLPQIPKLRATVALPERVDMVDVAQNRTRPLGKLVRPRSLEIPGCQDAAVDVRHANSDKPSRLEPALTIGDLHRTDLARSRIDILEQVTVNCMQMGEIEIASRNQLQKALADEISLRSLRRLRVPFIQFVAENAVIRWITVIAVAHTAAATRRSSIRRKI